MERKCYPAHSRAGAALSREYSIMRIPTATYRLQFHKGFTFSDAKAVVSYLRELGVSDLYASPIFRARADSVHGYDIVDPNQINAELGGAEKFDELAAEIQRCGMGWLQDIVPNHMAYDSENWMLMDVLENGPNSTYASFFDIEWDHPMENMHGKVLAPCLGQFYGQCLENGEIILSYDAQGLAVHYYKLRLPINIESYNLVLAPSLGALRRKLGPQNADLIKFLGVLYALKNLPSTEEGQERAEQIIFVKSMLWELYTTNPEIRSFLDENIARFNGRPGDSESFNALDQLMGQQHYRLSFWKVASEEINYRRFFNINELISLRVEDANVFETCHRLIFRLIRERKISGIRIDHIDGLYDPARYLRRIREKTGEFYVVVEKILELRENLPEEWPVCGTTGYEFTNYVNGLFCQNENEEKFTRMYRRFTGLDVTFGDLVSEKKRLIIGRYMAGDVDRLAHLLKRVSSRDRFGGDITLYGLKRALVEVLTFFPVYRSYISPESFGAEDRSRMQEALRKANEMNPGLVLELSFIGKFLMLEHGDHAGEQERSQWIDFIMRLQQLTGPLMAKGFEDTTLYIYNRFISLNEVGGDPSRFGIATDDFHRFIHHRAGSWPCALNATSTHDTKRGEDVRARLNVLSELPDEWDAHVFKWSEMNRRHKRLLKGREVPDRNDEYFLYQSLVGALPLEQDRYSTFVDRVKGYMIKAVREAKVHTGWLKPDADYEEAFLNFIEKILEPSEANSFLLEMRPWARRIARFGALNSLSQTLLKLTCPGVPDLYQGTELWDLHFVDPDNRRPVDFALRRKRLEAMQSADRENCGALLTDVLSHWEDGRVKLLLIFKTLNFRRGQPELFHAGSYIPLAVEGPAALHVCAFARRERDRWMIAAVPRFPTGLFQAEDAPLGRRAEWRDTALVLPHESPRAWSNVLTGENLQASSPDPARRILYLSEVLEHFPVALLDGDSPSRAESPATASLEERLL
jgi:(1->4)-alpha-D-glucan 1-alpha-D-glucosylmutase